MHRVTTLLSLLFIAPVPSALGAVVFEDGSVNTLNTTIFDNVVVRDSVFNQPTTLNLVPPGDVFGFVRVRNSSILNFTGQADAIDARDDSTVNVDDGRVFFDIFGDDNAVINITGGDHGQGGNFGLFLNGMSEATMTGGNFRDDVQVQENSTFTMLGGNVEDDFEVFDSGTAILTGTAIVEDDVQVVDNGMVTMTGGIVEGDFEVDGIGASGLITGGTIDFDIEADLGALITIKGGNIGAAGNGFDTGLFAGDEAKLVIHGSDFSLPLGPVAPMNGSLTGTLSDGSPFSMPFLRSTSGNIILVPEPATLSLLAMAVGAVWIRWRK